MSVRQPSRRRLVLNPASRNNSRSPSSPTRPTAPSSHPSAPASPGGNPQYYMTQLDTYGMTGNINSFRRGAAAYRNARQWTKEQRDQFIASANAAAPMQSPNAFCPNCWSAANFSSFTLFDIGQVLANIPQYLESVLCLRDLNLTHFLVLIVILQTKNADIMKRLSSSEDVALNGVALNDQ